VDRANIADTNIVHGARIVNSNIVNSNIVNSNIVNSNIVNSNIGNHERQARLFRVHPAEPASTDLCTYFVILFYSLCVLVLL